MNASLAYHRKIFDVVYTVPTIGDCPCMFCCPNTRSIAYLSLFFILVSADLLAQTPEYEVKAAFLLNFARFVSWPTQTAADKRFNICTFGEPPLTALAGIIRGETIEGQAIRVQKIDAADAVQDCRLVFMNEKQAAKVPEIIHALGTRPVLTVGEDADFLRNGGMIRFVQKANRIRFEINPMAAERAGLHINSRLLRLADIVSIQDGGNRQ